MSKPKPKPKMVASHPGCGVLRTGRFASGEACGEVGPPPEGDTWYCGKCWAELEAKRKGSHP